VQKHRGIPPFDHSCCKNLKIYKLNFLNINSNIVTVIAFVIVDVTNSTSKIVYRFLVSLCAKFHELVPVPVVH